VLLIHVDAQNIYYPIDRSQVGYSLFKNRMGLSLRNISFVLLICHLFLINFCVGDAAKPCQAKKPIDDYWDELFVFVRLALLLIVALFDHIIFLFQFVIK
jgi:hypothetical protein